jgi:hypothetical protein
MDVQIIHHYYYLFSEGILFHDDGLYFPRLPQKLNRLLIHANNRFRFIIGPLIDLKDIFRRRNEGRVLFRRNTPTFL